MICLRKRGDVLNTEDIRELLRDGENQHIVDLGENKEFAKSVTKLLLDIGFSHGCSGYSNGLLKSKSNFEFAWRYAKITDEERIEYCNLGYFEGDPVPPIISYEELKAMCGGSAVSFDITESEFDAELDTLMA